MAFPLGSHELPSVQITTVGRTSSSAVPRQKAVLQLPGPESDDRRGSTLRFCRTSALQQGAIYPAMITDTYANVLGIRIDAVNMTRAVAIMEAAVRRRRKGYVCVTGVH